MVGTYACGTSGQARRYQCGRSGRRTTALQMLLHQALSALFKVGAASGEVFMADLRRLSGDGTNVDPWVCIGDRQRRELPQHLRRKDGNNCRIECYQTGEKKVMRRNWVGDGPSMVLTSGEEKAKIVSWAFGGNRMALARVDKRSIEVWDSASGAIQVENSPHWFFFFRVREQSA
ncbi:hypothetical protein ZWY2020_006817 [Hordeum vulgare]|nr:hypothetical protein ZWY2020_006817 [Hordeum vulgare]